MEQQLGDLRVAALESVGRTLMDAETLLYAAEPHGVPVTDAARAEAQVFHAALEHIANARRWVQKLAAEYRGDPDDEV